jgi:hypothetical protein
MTKQTSVFQIKYTTIALIAFSVASGAVPAHYATKYHAEYKELKILAQKEADIEGKKTLASLGYIAPFYVDSTEATRWGQ